MRNNALISKEKQRPTIIIKGKRLTVALAFFVKSLCVLFGYREAERASRAVHS